MGKIRIHEAFNRAWHRKNRPGTGKRKVMAMKKNPGNNGQQDSTEIFYPSFLFKEIVVIMLIVFLVTAALAITLPTGLEDPADPTDNLYIPKPEWYFMSLYQLLKYFPGKLEVIASALIPAGGVMLLLLLPFIDKNPEKRPRRRPVAMSIMVLAVLAVIVLTAIGLAG
jgi:quinol-cytochrome oxidoreductase complex cytochrome b subunit